MKAQRESMRSPGRRLRDSSVTKKDIQEAESMVVQAEQIVSDAFKKHNYQAPHQEQQSSSATCEPNKLEAKVAKFRQDLIAKEASLPPKFLLGKQLTKERIEMCVTEFKAGLQQSMRKEPTRKTNKKQQQSLALRRPSISHQVYNATRRCLTPQASNEPESPQTPSPSKPVAKVDMVELNSGDTIPIVFSPTGFAHFPRHWEDDDEWERLSQHSVLDADDMKEAEQEPLPKKNLLSNWLSK